VKQLFLGNDADRVGTLFAIINTAGDGSVKSYEVNDLLADLKPLTAAYDEAMTIADYFVSSLIAATTTTEHFSIGRLTFSQLLTHSVIVDSIWSALCSLEPIENA
jgi:hypothetical protein